MNSLSFNQKLVQGSEPVSLAPPAGLPSVDVEKPIPLKCNWSLWEQLQQSSTTASPAEVAGQAAASQSANYGDLTRKVATISDIQSFWKYFVHLPQPSAILGESMKVVRQESEDGPAHTLAALMLFKENVRPEWEDEANRKGGHFQFTLQLERSRPTKEGTAAPVVKDQGGSTAWLAQTDEYWNNLVLGLIGGTLDTGDFVTGVRLVDKVKLPVKPGSRAVGHIRLEIWFRDASDTAKINALEESVETHLKCKLDGSISSEVFPGYRLDMRTHEESAHGDAAAAKTGNIRRRPQDKPAGAVRKFGSRKPSADAEVGGELSKTVKATE